MKELDYRTRDTLERYKSDFENYYNSTNRFVGLVAGFCIFIIDLFLHDD